MEKMIIEFEIENEDMINDIKLLNPCKVGFRTSMNKITKQLNNHTSLITGYNIRYNDKED